ncbi:MAG: Hsp20/alpha crystallin family protein [Myxococcales bacterium]|nr:Hsp20/alpha crystallin family protein [Myxococcales bacterium]
MLATWDPFSELSRVQDEMQRWLGSAERAQGFRPAVDIHEDEKAYTLHVELPGLKAEEVDISVDGNVLTLRGERKIEKKTEEKGKAYRHIERSYGAFMRRFSLPDTVNAEGIVANMGDGVLTLTVPKQDLPKPKRIAIKAS